MLAWNNLTNKTVKEVGYGGAAGGGKSWLGCLWVAVMCEAYPGTAWGIGRKELKNLKRTTLRTFFSVMAHYGWESPHHYRYNQQDSAIHWHNGSVIHLLDMAYQPSDPLFLRFGGLELTGAFVDESNEMRQTAISILKTRIGRCKNKEYELSPTLFESFNPDKGHVYSRYYKPWKQKELPEHMCFIKALPTDNPHLSEDYIEQLRNSDQVTRERLLNGNFEYDDDPAKLMEYDAIVDIFTNKGHEGDDTYISVDVARMGSDRAVVFVWSGLQVKKTVVFDKCRTTELVAEIQSLEREHHVRRSHVVVDEDGVGGGVVDQLSGCKGFVNNSKAIDPKKTVKRNYANLKTQCYFELARLVNTGKIGIDSIKQEYKELLIQELEQIKQKDIDKEAKINLVGKEHIKDALGRSPDFADALMMRMYFELKPKPDITPIFV